MADKLEAKTQYEPIAVRPAEAARLLGVSRPKIYELIARDDCQRRFEIVDSVYTR